MLSELSITFSALAIQLTQMFGQPMAFSRETHGDYNPETGVTNIAQVINYSAMGVPLNYEADEIDGTIIEREDTRVFIHHVVGVIPKVGDLLLNFRDSSWRVLNVQIHPVNAIDVLYGMQVRK